MLFVAAGAVAVSGAALSAWPLIDQANPSAEFVRSPDVDLATIREGQAHVLKTAIGPVMVRHLAKDELLHALSIPASEIHDPLARNANLDEQAPAIGGNRLIAFDPRFAVMSPICTKTYSGGGRCLVTDHAYDGPGGFMCSCCNSVFDALGRVIKGIAPSNLPIPRIVRMGRSGIILG